MEVLAPVFGTQRNARNTQKVRLSAEQQPRAACERPGRERDGPGAKGCIRTKTLVYLFKL